MDANTPIGADAADFLSRALKSVHAQERLRAAMDAGTAPQPAFIPLLLAQCRIEPDFYVRETLTWALVRHDHDDVLPLVLAELDSPIPQARSQALHTLSKVGDVRAWPAITLEHVADADDEIARTAWRAAAALAPLDARAELAHTLATQFARGDRDVRRSLSRALLELGAEAAPAVYTASQSTNSDISAHALATQHLLENPHDSFDAAEAEAAHIIALRESGLHE